MERTVLNSSKVSKRLAQHYKKVYALHGDTPAGVDWGIERELAVSRQRKMLDLIIKELSTENKPSVLDVGCGYGALVDLIKQRKLDIDYFGLEIVHEMLTSARAQHPECTFIEADFLESDEQTYDYLVCNGILTQKLSTSKMEMDLYAKAVIKKMFRQCKKGIAFNVMNTNVNFQSDNLYYHSPVEMIAWCISELSPRVKLDCAYEPWYEYTVYLYKNENS